MTKLLIFLGLALSFTQAQARTTTGCAFQHNQTLYTSVSNVATDAQVKNMALNACRAHGGKCVFRGCQFGARQAGTQVPLGTQNFVRVLPALKKAPATSKAPVAARRAQPRYGDCNVYHPEMKYTQQDCDTMASAVRATVIAKQAQERQEIEDALREHRERANRFPGGFPGAGAAGGYGASYGVGPGSGAGYGVGPSSGASYGVGSPSGAGYGRGPGSEASYGVGAGAGFSGRGF